MPRISLSTPNFKLHKLPSGIFEVRWEKDGKTQKRSTRTRDRKMAEEVRARISAEELSPAPPKEFSVCDMLRAYEAEKMASVHSPGTLKYSTEPLIRFFEGMTAKQLRSDAVYAKYRKWRTAQTGRTSKRPVADTTAVRELNTLRGAVSWARRNGWGGLDQVQIHVPNSAARARYRYLTPTEAKTLLKHCAPHVALFVRIAIATGARMSAILELTWDRVHWDDLETDEVWHDAVEHFDEKGRLHVLDGEYIEKEVQTKPVYLDFGAGRGNKKRARVPIIHNLPLYRGLRTAQKAARSAFVIEYRGKGIKSVATALEAAYAAAGIEGATVHTLKHTCCSWLVQSGVKYQEVATIIGTSAQVIEDHYGHLSPDHLTKIAATLTI